MIRLYVKVPEEIMCVILLSLYKGERFTGTLGILGIVIGIGIVDPSSNALGKPMNQFVLPLFMGR